MTELIDAADRRTPDDTIAQTGPGLPDDTGRSIDLSETEIAAVRATLEDRSSGPSAGDNRQPRRAGPEVA